MAPAVNNIYFLHNQWSAQPCFVSKFISTRIGHCPLYVFAQNKLFLLKHVTSDFQVTKYQV